MSAADIEAGPGSQGSASTPETTRSRRRREVLAILVLIILALLTCCCLTWSQIKEIPDVVEMAEEEARAALEEAGFRVRVVYADDAAGGTGTSGTPGTVTDQSPEAGTRARAGTTVTITVAGGVPDGDAGDGVQSDGSGGGRTVDGGGSDTFDPASRFTDITASGGSGPQVPTAQNVSESAARRILEAAGYRMVVGGFGPTTAGVTEGNVYYQEPAPGSSLPRGATVTVWISTGAPHKDGYEGVPYPAPTNP